MFSFTTMFKDELLNLLETKTKAICKNEKIDYSKGQYKIKFDGCIEKKDEIVIIEIEFRRADPVNNLIKIIHWMCHSIRNKKAKMIQLYDENYYSIPENKYKKDFTLFLARRCNLLHKKLDKFRYIPMDVKVDQKAFRKKDPLVAQKLAKTTYYKLIRKI